MIEPRELRIGNLLLNDGCQCEVMHIYGGGYTHCTLKTKQGNEINAYYKLINPIPLTENWLLKFGFEADGVCWNKKGFKIWISSDEDNDVLNFYHLNDETLTHFNSVHHLQNYYFFMTLMDNKGEELEVKNDRWTISKSNSQNS